MTASTERAIALVEEAKKRQLEKFFENLEPLEFRTLFKDLSPEGIRKVLRVVAEEKPKDVLEKVAPLFGLVELMPQLLVLHESEERLRLYVFDEEKRKYKRRASAKISGRTELVTIPGNNKPQEFFTFLGDKILRWKIKNYPKLSLESRVVGEFKPIWNCVASSDGTLFVSGDDSITKVNPDGSTLAREEEQVRKLFLFGEDKLIGVVGGDHSNEKERLLFFEASELKLLFKVEQVFLE